MSGTRHEPQLLVARLRLEKRANHPGGDIIVGIAVDESAGGIFATCASDEASRKFHPYFRSHSQLAVYSNGNAGSPNDDFSSLENSSQTPV